MSYATAPTFEGNYFGVRRLRTLGYAGHMLGALGDAALDSYVQAAIYAGFNSDDINTLVAGGATSNDLSNLINGNTTIADLLNKLYPPDTTAAPTSTGINPAVAPPAPTSPTGTPNYSMPSPPQSPQGSVLIYQASWSAGATRVAASVALAMTTAQTNGNLAIAGLANALPAQQGKITGGSPSSNGPVSYSISVTVQDNSGHARIVDLQSVLDALLSQVVGVPVTSTLSLLQYGVVATNPGAGPGATQTMTQWFQANWMVLAGGLAAIAVLGIVVQKR